MKYMFFTMIAVSIFLVSSCACVTDKCEPTTTSSAKMDKLASQNLELCGDCGEVKGSDKCCVPEAEKCEKCGLNKGAPGCCK